MTEMPYFIPFQGLCRLECAAFALKQLHYVKHCLKYDHLSIIAMDISGSEMDHIYSCYDRKKQCSIRNKSSYGRAQNIKYKLKLNSLL